MDIKTPDWVKHAVFYQIFPDRFARSHRVSPPTGVRFKPWGAPPDEQGFQGGDLYGIVERLDYLVDLGVNALYLNPIFASAANHRYHTFDYFEVDPLLGGNEALRRLLDEAHSRGVRVVLDGVFNHASRGFWPFHHLLENGVNSPYLDWFIVEDWPLRPYDEEHRPHNYAAWWGLPALPKLNTENRDVQQYIFSIARHWIEFGVDGWRLDVPSEIDDDEFWRSFRTVVKTANPEAYICGEIWGDGRRWLQGDQFDSVMNYIFAWSTMSFFGGRTLRPGYQRMHYKLEPLDAAGFAETISYMLGLYDWEINLVQLNLLDSHDTARALWIMGEDVEALKLSVLFQMTMPGSPCIYYGDEIGMSAGDDPHCREAFPWYTEQTWNRPLREHYARAIALRHKHEVFRTGSFEIIYARGETLVFERRLEGSVAYIVFNAGIDAVQVELDMLERGGYQEVWPITKGATYIDVGESLNLHLPPRTARILVSSV